MAGLFAGLSGKMAGVAIGVGAAATLVQQSMYDGTISASATLI